MRPITEKGIDGIADMLLDSGAKEVTRDDWIDFSYLGDIPDPWTDELEDGLPEQLRISQAMWED